MAAPHVAGAFAVLKSRTPMATVNDMENALRSTGTTITETRFGVLFAKPRINVDLALAFQLSEGVVADFNADAMSDILFRKAADGRAVVWQMNGMNVTDAAEVGSPPVAWQIEDIGDSNGTATPISCGATTAPTHCRCG